VLSAIHQYGRTDYALSGLTIFLVSTPAFLLALVALYLFGVTLKVLPVGELFTFGKEDDIIDRAAHVVMPAMILGLANAALLTRYTRASMLDVLNGDHITTARAKGLANRTVMIRHGLRNALIPIITVLAILLPELIAGAIITETIFNWPGLGQLSVRAARDRDPALMMGVVLVVGTFTVLASIVADFAYSVVDPRIRYVSGQ
jgi:peptide/nickel transport system permease protein